MTASVVSCGAMQPSDSSEKVSTTSDALTAAGDGFWHWFDGSNGLPGLACMDNSPSGIGINVPARWNGKVLIWLDGGGLCYDNVTCTTTLGVSPHVAHITYGLSDFNNDVGYDTKSPLHTPVLTPNVGDGNYDVAAFTWSKAELERGIFDRTGGVFANPFAQYAYVFVPYCTGDLHIGNNYDCTPGGSCTNTPFAGRTPSGYHHNGYSDTVAAYNAVVSTFPTATKYVLTGGSAGGMGTILTYSLLRSRVSASVPITAISDAGDPMWTGSPTSGSTWTDRQGFWLRENPDGSQRTPPAPGVESYIEDFMANAWQLTSTQLPGIAPVSYPQAHGPIYRMQDVWIHNATTNLSDSFSLIAATDDYAYAWLLPLNGPPPPFPLFGNGGPDGAHPNVGDALADIASHATFSNTTLVQVSFPYRPPLSPACNPSCANLRIWKNHHTFLLDDTSVWDSTFGGSGVKQFLGGLGI